MTGSDDESVQDDTDLTGGEATSAFARPLPPPDPSTDAPSVRRDEPHASGSAGVEGAAGAVGTAGAVAVADEEPHRRHRRHRSWGQRAVLVFNLSVAFMCLIAAAVIWYANDQLGQRKLVDIGTSPSTTTVIVGTGAATTAGGASPSVAATEAPASTFPAATDGSARNFLLTGSDSRACIPKDSPYAGAFLGSGSDIGERSDTIMMLRVDPTANQAAILSFPRDLWVTIADSNRKSRINAAFDTQDPTKLIKTIELNFGVHADHYINVDFCAFKGIVDAVNGVAVPFAFPARDKNTGLNITQPECHTFQGDEALAYVRSRHYQYFDAAKNTWFTDGTSDYGRITRQQDFLKRALKKALDNGARNPIVAQKLLRTMQQYVTSDTNLTLDVMLQLAGAMRTFDPNSVRTFQIEGQGVVKGNADVIEPVLTSPRMKSILDVFRGNARLADVPTTTTPSTETTAPGGETSAPETSAPSTTAPPTTTGGPTTSTGTNDSVVVVNIDDTAKGLYPPADPTCH